MFNTTLRYLSLIILPHPSFDVPISEPDPLFRIHGRKSDNDTSYISQNQISQFGPAGFSTPRKPELSAGSHERRRNTICCYSCHCPADPFPAKEKFPTWPVNTSFNSLLSSDASKHNLQENVPGPSTSNGTRIDILTPHSLPSPSSSWPGQPQITSFVNFSDSSDGRVTPEHVWNKKKNSRCSPRKGKNKRHSAPPAVSLKYKDQFGLKNSGAIDITSTNESIQPPNTSQSLPKLLHKDQHQKPHVNSISPYTSKQFEIGLSPIIEDTHIFTNTLQALKSVEVRPTTNEVVDSSGSSYGELIQTKTIDYLGTSEYETFRGLEWESPERRKQPESSAHFDTQSYVDHQGDRYWSDEFWETFEDASLIPELTLTAPTPEMGISAEFHSEDRPGEHSCDDYQRPEANFAPQIANTCQPNRLGCTTTLASISKALGTGADRLLGVGNGVFDDMLDTGIVCGATSRPLEPAVVHPGDVLSNDWLGSLTARSLNDQTEPGFLGQLLRRKSTGRSKISEPRSRAWKRVSHILQSSQRSSRSASDQENFTTPTPAEPREGSHPGNGPLNASPPSRGWKRFSRIFSNATVSSRRKFVSDQAQFIEPIDTLERGCSGLSDFGNTRRNGMDISVEHVGERCYGSSSPSMATRAYINEKHAATYIDKPTDASKNTGTSRHWYGTLFGTDVKSRAPRRHSFGIGKRISKHQWRYSAECPGMPESS